MKKRLPFIAALLIVLLSPSFSTAQCAGFYDGFESGSYTPTWTVGTAPITWSVTTTNPAAGTYRLEGTGGNSSHLQGLLAQIPAATPSNIGWWMFPSGTVATNYVVIGDNTMAANNCVSFCYWVGGNNIRFVSSTTYNYVATPGQWYHVEMRNINWTARTYDIYINNVLQYTAFPFRTTTQSTMTRIHLYNFNTGATAAWDDITVGGAPINLSSFVTNSTCNGSNNGGIDLTATGGTGTLTYAWSNTATTQDITGITPGTYSVTVTDNVGCTATLTGLSVTEPPVITTTLTPTDPLCNGGADGSIDLTVSGGTPGYSYLWTTTATTEDISGLIASQYNVLISDANGCLHSDSVMVNQPTALAITSSGTNLTCYNDSSGSASVGASGGTPGYNYLWSTGDNTSAIFNLVAGTYTCTITDINGCSASDIVTITEPAQLIHSLSVANALCNGDSNATVTATVTGGTPGYSYQWPTGDTTNVATGLPAGFYYFIVSDALGCTNIDSFTVTEPTAITATISSTNSTCNAACNGTAMLANMAGGSGTLSLVWPHDNSNNASVSNLCPGTYTCIVTDTNNCSSTFATSVTEPSAIVITGQPTNPSGCGSFDGMVDLTVSGGTPTYQFSWSNSFSSEDIGFVGAGVYSVIVTDSLGCSDSAMFTLNDPAPPVVDASINFSNVCVTDGNYTLAGAPAGGTWSGPGVTGNSFSPSAAGNGTHSLVYSYTDPNTSCTNSDTVAVVVNACVGIQSNNAVANSISVYPNPNNGLFTIGYAAYNKPVPVVLYNALGEEINSWMLSGNTTQIDIQTLPVGVYTLRIVTETGISSVRVIRQ
jgi:hypothetical protein